MVASDSIPGARVLLTSDASHLCPPVLLPGVFDLCSAFSCVGRPSNEIWAEVPATFTLNVHPFIYPQKPFALPKPPANAEIAPGTSGLFLFSSAIRLACLSCGFGRTPVATPILLPPLVSCRSSWEKKKLTVETRPPSNPDLLAVLIWSLACYRIFVRDQAPSSFSIQRLRSCWRPLPLASVDGWIL